MIKAFAAVVLLGIMEVPAAAQVSAPRRFLIDTWQGEQGLPQNTVTGIAQTPDGYLWVSTLDGLVRFDGAHFQMFKAGDTPALGSGRIRFLFQGQRGTLWLATQEGGVIQLRNDRFVPLPMPERPGVRPATFNLVESTNGDLWLSGEEGSVSSCVKGQWSVVSTNWGAHPAFELRADFQGRLWGVNNQGLFQFDGLKLTPAIPGETTPYMVLAPSRSGGWWIYARGQIRHWRDGQWLASTNRPELRAERMTCSLEDHAGVLWLGTSDAGLLRCEPVGTMLPVTKREGLGGNSVRVLFEDSEGALWVGLEGGGLSRLRAPLFAVYGPAQGLSSERITSVSEGADGALWIGTDGAGVNCLTGETARAVVDNAAAASWRISAVMVDRQRRLWTTLRAGGIFRGPPNETLTRLQGFPTDGLPTRSLFQDSHGTVWIGQRNTRALLRVEGDTVNSVELPASWPVVDVRCIAEDAAGNLWFGTDGSGLLRLHAGQFTRLTRENGLSSDFVWALRPEPDGTLWIGSYGGGLTRLKEGRAIACTTRDGLVDDVICHIADDGHGQYWFSSNQGVFRIAKRDLNRFADGQLPRIQCVAYGRSDGLPTLECEGGCQPAGCHTHDGRLWFPTIRGLVAVDPAAASMNPRPPLVHIEEMIVDGRRLSQSAARPFGPHGLQAAHPAGSVQLDIRPGARRLEFRYTALDFSAPEKLRFRHKLAGVDADWVDTGNQRQASYDRLAPGTYTFHVQACNREGIWNEAGDQFTFAVQPFFWQTGWFATVFLVGFGGLVGWIVACALRRRHERRLKFLEQLHALERERTRIARDIHDDLGGSLTEIGYLGALAVRDSQTLADARDQIQRMMDRTRDVARRLDETVWAVNPKNDSLSHLVTYLCQFAREFLAPATIRCRLDIAPDLPPAALTAEVRHNIFLVVKEALNNAVKHAQAAEIRIHLAVADRVLSIEIADNGCGFVEGTVSETGNGLRNMAARMEEIGGRSRLQTAPGRGTNVFLELRLPTGPDLAGAQSPPPIQMEDARGEAKS